jgi:glucokinase
MNGSPVLEVGGTHILASRVDPATWRVRPGSAHRLPLDSAAAAGPILATLAAAAGTLHLAPGETLAVAIPGPFDYPAGIGHFHGVGKFDSLAGVDVGGELLARLADPPARVAFINDADAFGLGEWLVGAARGYDRAVAITLGTGIGSVFVAGGLVVPDGPAVPPGGEVYRLTIGGRPLEDTVSRRAIIAAYREAAPTAGAGADVREIAALARGGDEPASRVFNQAFEQLGGALAPWLARFCAQVLVAGGGIAAAWPLIEPPLRRGLGPVAAGLVIARSADPAAAAAAGAAWHAAHGHTRAPAAASPAAQGPGTEGHGAAPGTLTPAGPGGP